jgi:hypothetical protein
MAAVRAQRGAPDSTMAEQWRANDSLPWSYYAGWWYGPEVEGFAWGGTLTQCDRTTFTP